MILSKEKLLKFCTVRNLFNLAYVIAVFVLLLIPTVSVKLKKDLHVENRKAAPFPQIDWRNCRSFSAQFEAWFSDRFGTRKRCVKVWNFLLVHCFQESPSSFIVLGKDGFIFYASHFAGEENRNSLFNTLLLYDDTKVQAQADHLYGFKSALPKGRPQVLFVSVPTKHTLNYDKVPDKLRKTFRNNPEGIPLYTKVLEKLHQKDPEFADKYFLDLYPRAMAENRKLQLIPIKNCHWVSGPYTHLATNQIARKLGVIKEDWVFHREYYVKKELDSDLGFFFAYDVTSPALRLSPRYWRIHPVPLAMRLQTPYAYEAIRRSEFYALNPAAPGGRILVFGDSFCNPMCPNFASYFKETITMEFTAMLRFSPEVANAHIKEIKRLYDPDYIVVVSHGSFIFPELVAELTAQP